MARPGTALPDPNLVRLATLVQGTFLVHGHSLADPQTADIYRTGLDALLPILDGALHTGVLTDAQHTTLTGMFDAARTVPEVL
jgi:hypothetical protein